MYSNRFHQGKALPVLKCLVVVVDRALAEKVTALYRRNRIRFHLIFLAEGTASSDLIDVLGLGNASKSIIVCLQPQAHMEGLMQELNDLLDLRRKGRGVAFTLPLSGISNPILNMIDQEQQSRLMAAIDKEVEKMKENAKYDLILACVNEGYSDNVMDAAKEAGAGGGTVLYAKKIGLQEGATLFGIPVEVEKEVIAILSPHEKKTGIMRAIGERWGIRSEAHGILFALPVDSYIGLEDLEKFCGEKKVEDEA